LSDFDDPTATDDYAVCFYEEDSGDTRLVGSLAMPAGSDCTDGTCWRRARNAFRFNEQTAERRASASLSVNSTGGVRILVKAKGRGVEALQTPAALPVRVQLQGPDEKCWDAEYADSNVSVNETTRLRGR
jgi:hypothetical protein